MVEVVTVKPNRRRRPAPAALQEQFETLRSRFPARPVPWTWPRSLAGRDEVLQGLTIPPLHSSVRATQYTRTAGIEAMLDWLGGYPGRSWQQRWMASGADDLSSVDWLRIPLGVPVWIRPPAHGNRPGFCGQGC